MPQSDFLGSSNTLPDIENLQENISKKIDSFLDHSFGKSSIFPILRDYPTRAGKMLRPAICIAACGAVGGNIENAYNTAAAIELIHNAFLIKDDIVDGSDFRRGKTTLNRMHGLEIAINAGDALKVISLSALLDNLPLIGIRKSLQIMLEFIQMARFSVEGQLMDVEWVKKSRVDLTQKDYYEMCVRKSCWYTTIGPCRTGVTIGSEFATPEQLAIVTDFATKMGLAFQIRDDLLNLLSTFKEYGKEINGDIWEGKRTVMLIHLLENCLPSEKKVIAAILKKERSKKKAPEITYIRELMDRCGSISYADNLSNRYAKDAIRVLDRKCGWMTNKPWKRALRQLIEYVVSRNK